MAGPFLRCQLPIIVLKLAVLSIRPSVIAALPYRLRGYARRRTWEERQAPE